VRAARLGADCQAQDQESARRGPSTLHNNRRSAELNSCPLQPGGARAQQQRGWPLHDQEPPVASLLA